MAVFSYKGHSNSERLWREILESYPDHRSRAEKLLENCVKVSDKGAMVIDLTLCCEALGEAEEADALDLAAESYKLIGSLWGKQYPALSLSLWRKAEELYAKTNNTNELEQLKPNLSLSLFLTGEKYEVVLPDIANQFRKEAKKKIRSIDESAAIIDDSNTAYIKYAQGVVLQDPELLSESRYFYINEQLWQEAMMVLDEEIRLAINANEKERVLYLLQLDKDCSIKCGDTDFAEFVEERISNYDHLVVGSRFLHPGESQRTVLDILDVMSAEEESYLFSDNYNEFHSYGVPFKEGLFIPTSDGHLFPTFRGSFRLFRGQTQFYEKCQPAFWRDNMDDKMRMIERLKLIEFEKMVKKFQQYDIFSSGLIVNNPFGWTVHYPLHVDLLALAQHYGIKTELLDLTSDKWTAAFFACTDYDEVHDSYSPRVSYDDSAGDTGIIYIYIGEGNDFQSKSIRVVGAQPFLRPVEQASFMKEMKNSTSNFNDFCADSFSFHQEPGISVLVCHFANRANRLFPDEPIQKRTHELVMDKSLRFPKDTIETTHERFYPELDDAAFYHILRDIGVEEVDSPIITLGPDDLTLTPEHIKSFENIFSRVRVCWLPTNISNKNQT